MSTLGLDPALSPRRAPVVPRARASAGGEVLPVEDFLRPLVEGGHKGAVAIVGGRGSGKTTALAHLASVFGPGEGRWYLDQPSDHVVSALSSHSLLIYTRFRRPQVTPLATLTLAPWGDDEAIEYLLACHHERCASVIGRLRRDDARHSMLGGATVLWRTVLDEMAEHEALPDVSSALRRALNDVLPAGPLRYEVAAFAARMFHEVPVPHEDLGIEYKWPLDVRRLFAHPPVRVLLAAECVLAVLMEATEGCLAISFPSPDLVRQVALLSREWTGAQEALSRALSRPWRLAHPLVASVLLARDSAWRPADDSTANLAGAWLPRAQWKGIALPKAGLSRVRLDWADLTDACLDDCLLSGASMQGARLVGANLRGVWANGIDLGLADLSSADLFGAHLEEAILEGANLDSASLVKADLSGASLARAKLHRADLRDAVLKEAHLEGADLSSATLKGSTLVRVDLTTARLAGTHFVDANLFHCNLEGVRLEAPCFRGAVLTGSCFTGSVMPRADFHGATLRETGLAEVEWEGTDLRDADLTHASFHLGSSRCGLVGSPIACEGSKTGFYTDDSLDQGFKPPAEVRKANLRGADLRGARVFDTDFYLVDLRGAKYTPDQRDHFERCRAILRDRSR